MSKKRKKKPSKPIKNVRKKAVKKTTSKKRAKSPRKIAKRNTTRKATKKAKQSVKLAKGKKLDKKPIRKKVRKTRKRVSKKRTLKIRKTRNRLEWVIKFPANLFPDIQQKIEVLASTDFSRFDIKPRPEGVFALFLDDSGSVILAENSPPELLISGDGLKRYLIDLIATTDIFFDPEMIETDKSGETFEMINLAEIQLRYWYAKRS